MSFLSIDPTWADEIVSRSSVAVVPRPRNRGGAVARADRIDISCHKKCNCSLASIPGGGKEGGEREDTHISRSLVVIDNLEHQSVSFTNLSPNSSEIVLWRGTLARWARGGQPAAWLE